MPDESNTKTSNSPKNIDTPKKPKSKVKVKEKKTKTSNSELYYFSSTGCAFCKQVEPIVDKLIGDGFNILKLDTSESDNAGLKRELENKYNLRCGTPWLIDPNTGNNICGKRDEATIRKWAKGEEIPKPPQPKGPPPPPPKDFENTEEVERWKNAYIEWSKENNHLPNVPDVETMLGRLKERNEMMKKQLENNKRAVGDGTGGLTGGQEARIQRLEQKLDKLMKHLGVK